MDKIESKYIGSIHWDLKPEIKQILETHINSVFNNFLTSKFEELNTKINNIILSYDFDTVLMNKINAYINNRVNELLIPIER